MDMIEKQWSNCVSCGGQVLPVVYGLVAPELLDSSSVILGGCLIDGTGHEAECKDCGKPFEQRKRTFVPIAEYTLPGPDNNRIRLPQPIDFSKLQEDQLFGLAGAFLEARLELIVRGWHPLAIEEYCASKGMRHVCLQDRHALLAVYNPRTKKVEAGFQYYRYLDQGMFCFALPGMDEWEATLEKDDFDELMSTFDLETLKVWNLAIPLDQDDETPGMETWGISALAAAFSGDTIDEYTLSGEGLELTPPVLWPAWFDPDEVLEN